MKYFFYILLCLVTKGLCAQTDYFAKTFDIDEGSDSPWSVIIENDGYVVCENGFAQSLQGWRAIKLFKTDFSGNLEWHKVYGKVNYAYFNGLSGAFFKDSRGGFTFGGNYYDSGRITEEALLMKFNSTGDTIWTKSFGGNDFDAFFHTIQTRDSGYALIGQTKSFGDIDGDFYLVKTDSTGNFQWQQTYGGFLDDEGRRVEQLSDGGFILSGHREFFGNDFKGYIIRTDSLGNILWDTTYGTEGDDIIREITATKDGGFLLWGGLDTTFTFGDQGLATFVSKLDANGNIIWRTYFNSPQRNNIWQLRELANGEILFVGEKFDPSINNEAGWIMKLDKNGNKLWERLHIFTLDTIDHQKTIKFRGDFQQTSDNGFIVTGVVFARIDNSNVFQQDALLMKLDSMGCLVPGCDTITGIFELPTQQAEINVLPNPFSHSALVAIRLNEVNPNEQLHFNLYNLSGQLVQSKSINTNQYGYTEFQLQRNSLSSGIYFYEFTSDIEFLSRGKIVIQ